MKTPEPLFLWVTRSAPFAHLTAQHLRAIGHSPLVAPVLRILPIQASPPAEAPDMLVFTSRHGVRHHPFDPHLAHVPVLTVGDRTAKAAENAGYGKVLSADGNVTDLRDLILSRTSGSARIVHYGAREPAGDLIGELRAAGHAAERICVYASRETEAGELGAVAAALPWLDGILVHSPRAARCVAGFLGAPGRTWSGTIYCISEAAALPFASHPGIVTVVAAKPNEQALLERLGERIRGKLPSMMPPPLQAPRHRYRLRKESDHAR